MSGPTPAGRDVRGALTRADRGSLTKYDPDRGLKTLAFAEAAERHYARAKDATKLQQAIRAKLTAQAEFVTWWDHVAEKDRGAAQPRRSRSATALRAGTNGLPDRYVIDRWRRKLATPDLFEQAYDAACARYLKILELTGTAHVGQATGNSEWYTPAVIVEAARTVLGEIDLDPASCPTANAVIKAARFFSHEDDGLTQPWRGRLWLNPPYALGVIDQFIAKLAASVTTGDVSAAVVLVNNATETEWFQAIWPLAAAICFPNGRLSFWREGRTATPLQGQAVIYLGPAAARFRDEFAPFGRVCRLWT